MKKIYLLFASLILCHVLCAQTPFGFSEKYGFGPLQSTGQPNASITGAIGFKGNLYVATGSDSGYVYRSATGDPGSFQRVYQGPFVRLTNNFAVTNDGAMGGYLFMAADISTAYGNPKIQRTADGVTWNDYFELPFATMATSINTFSGSGTVDTTYITYSSQSGAYTFLYRNSVDTLDPLNTNGNWQLVADFNNDFGEAGSVKSSVVFNGKLYFAMSDGAMYETGNGSLVLPNTAFYNTIGAGSGLYNSYASAMAVHGGNLYIGTCNNSTGYEIWTTSDGINYTNLLNNTGYLNECVVNMVSSGGRLWFVTRNTFSHSFGIFSYDGANFTSENSNMFGVPFLNVDNFSAMADYSGHLYVGATYFNSPSRIANPDPHALTIQPGFTTGGQLWRACMTGAFPAVNVTSPNNPAFKCFGSTNAVTMSATTDAVSYQWSTGATTLSTTTPDTGHFYITGVAANGCRYSDEQNIHPYPVSPHVDFDAEYPDVSGTNVCRGDTSIRVYAYDPNNPDNGLVIPYGDAGFTTPSTNAFLANRDITVELWFKPYYMTEGPVFSEAAAVLPGSYGNISMIRIATNGDVMITLHGSSLNETNLGNISSAYNQWHHIVLRYSDGSGNFDGFLDRVQSSLDTRTRVIPQDGGDADCYKICMQSLVEPISAVPYNANGIIRDVRIWNSVRTNQEVLDNMYGLPAGSYPSLVYHYKADGAVGDTVITDYSANGSDTLINNQSYFVHATPVTWTASPTMINLGNNYAQFHPAVETEYTAVYTDMNGCTSDTGRFDVLVPYIQINNFYNPGGPFVSCGGNAVFVTPISNVGPHATTWNSPSMGGPITTYSTAVAPTTSEYLQVRDTVWGYCPLVDSVLVLAGPDLVLNNSAFAYGCVGSDVVLDLQSTGGTAPLTVTWNNSSQVDTTHADTLVYTMPPGMGNVSVYAIDAIGCYASTTFSTSATPSTDLHGHVSTPPPASLNVDNGEVYVFRHQPGSAGLDTMGHASLNANGDYLFTPLFAGNYLIKVLPDPTDFPLGVPTYFGNAFQWDSSIVYTHGCAQTDTADIELVVMDGSTGSATISGYILEGDAFGASRFGSGTHPLLPCVPGGPLKGIDVKLGKNPGGGIQARVSSDTSGFYEFTMIPDGIYTIYVDIPNLPMDSTRQVIVNAGDSSIQNNYFADSASIYINPDTVYAVGIYASAKNYENGFSIYPNPAHGELYINYNLQQSDYVSFEIRNAMGQVVRTEPSRKHPEGKNIFVFNTQQLNLQSGVYFISILTDNKKYTQRIVVIE
jgi:hypothetical protein